MPVIPAEYVGNNAFPDRPPQAEINPEAYGKDASALANLGGEIGDIGSRLLSARKTAMENDMVANAQSDDSTWLPKTVEGLRRQFAKTNPDGSQMVNPDGSLAYDPTGFADALKEQMDQRVNDNVDSMPTGTAQRMYRDRTQHMFNSAYAGAYDWENRTRVETMQNNIELRAQNDANNIVNSVQPYQDTMMALDRLRVDVNTAAGPDGILAPDSAEKIYRSKAKSTVDAMFAAYAKNPGMAQEGLDLINHISDPAIASTGNPGGSKDDAQKISNLVDPENLINYRNRLSAVVAKGNQEAVSAFEARYSGAMAGYKSTDPYVSSLVSSQDAHGLALQAIDMGNRGIKGQTWVQEHVMNLAMGEAFKRARDSIVDTPESQKPVFDARMQQEYQGQLRGLGLEDGSKFGLNVYEQQRKISDQMWNHAVAARKSDINKYFEDNHPEAPGDIVGGVPNAPRLKAREDYAKSMAISDQGLLTATEAKQKAAQILSQATTNPDAAVSALEQIKQNSLGYSDKVMGDLEKRGNLPRYFSIAASASSPAVEKEIIQLSDPQNSKALKESIPAAAKKDLFDEVGKSWAPAQASIRSVNPNPQSEGYNQEMLGLVQKKAIVYKNGGMSDEAAADQASKDIFYNDYHVVGGSAFMPKQVGGIYTNKDLVEAKMQAIRSAPPSSFTPPGGNPRMDQATKDSITNESIRTGKWVTDVTGPHPRTGAVFMVKDQRGLNTIPLLDEFGNKVRIDYASTGNDIGAINAYKPFWESRLGSDGKPAPSAMSSAMPHDDSGQSAVNQLTGKLQEQTINDKIKPGTSPNPTETDLKTSAGKGRSPKSDDGEDISGPDGSKLLLGSPEQYTATGTSLPSDVKAALGPPVPKKEPPAGISIGEAKESIINYSAGEIANMFHSASIEKNVPENILKRMGIRESNMDQNTPDSDAGAQGLMQIMPKTATALGLFNGWIGNEYRNESKDAKLAIPAAASLLRENLDRFGGDVRAAVAAYNFNPHGVQVARDKAIAAGAKPGSEKFYRISEDHMPLETRKYLRFVMGK